MLFRFSLILLTGISILALSMVSPPRHFDDLYPTSSEPAAIAKPTTSESATEQYSDTPISIPGFDVGSRVEPSNTETAYAETDSELGESAFQVFAAPNIDKTVAVPSPNTLVQVQPIEHSTIQNECCPCPHQHYQQRVDPYAQEYSHSILQQSHPAMNVNNLNLFQYRRMMLRHSAPQPHELQGTWRGVNTGIATLAIDKRFIKHFQSVGGQVYGDNISVNQNGGQPIYDNSTGGFKRAGKFQVQTPRGIGPFRHGAILSYRRGGNRLFDPANLIEDKLVKLDDNHMLGRATANFGPIKIPLAFFVLERIQ